MGALILILAFLGLLLLILIGIFSSQIATNFFEKGYRKDVDEAKSASISIPVKINERDIDHLPEPVKLFLRKVGVIGKPQINNFKALFNVEMRGKGQDWFSMKAEQFNFIPERKRLFYLKAKVKGLPTVGYHAYKDDQASMRIKLLGLLPVVNIPGGKKMFQAETVTFFNDLCIMAPAGLIDKAIEWEEINEREVRATFTNKGISISANLIFDEENRLVNFISDDRYDINEGKTYRFSTPLSEFKIINGIELPTYGEAIWHYPEGEFVYGKFHLKDIEYNV